MLWIVFVMWKLVDVIQGKVLDRNLDIPPVLISPVQ